MFHTQMKPFCSTHMPSGCRASHGYQVTSDHLNKLTTSIKQPDTVFLRIWVQQFRLGYQDWQIRFLSAVTMTEILQALDNDR
jgi:hypothetical protein